MITIRDFYEKGMRIKEKCQNIFPIDIMNFAEEWVNIKINDISDDYLDNLSFDDSSYQECDEEHYAFIRGAKWFKEQLLKK